ncbi:trypsin [Actinoplanes sp. SE50]|uniref:VIT domain-containing protein n=1 Tax=unclassified Actinoplanes TaxID=2626549 RepID=UPI00023ED21C|nr:MULTISPECIES: VIT domain-containing protein [unclassified Actinoplanes]AEV83885.1 Inter-alpha-trypsin inhibitor heavy chain H3 [Actinoplanes sp. SE50/110]ATO81971.1 trypsin [Actinoplanes sp. SE50]SLL99379.1 trypsin [Actinoplanes sp. SE50/110]
MIIYVNPMGPGELERVRPAPGSGFGSLRTDRGNLPLDRLDVQAAISGLVARTEVTAEFVNTHDTALEATYVFPLPDRAAVVGMTMTADGRTVTAELQERAAAREQYDQAVAAGQRASIAEEERPDVFTMRAGNILAGERIVVRLSLVGPMPFEDGAATYRFPLVVAPRYIPGAPLPGPYAGDGQTADTDAVPDASRISPPVLLPGFPNPLRLSLGVTVDAAGLELGEVRSSLHAISEEGGTLRIAPGERADRDFVLRLAYAPGGNTAVAVPDNDGEEGTYQIVILPPAGDVPPRPKDVVLLLDRSGSMGGWKMVAARRAAARVIDTLTGADRFAVLTFDHQVERPDGVEPGLSEATDRNRFRAIEHLARADARGGTELLTPLTTGLGLLADSTGRDRVLVLVTDGQVGNEDQIVHEVTPLIGSTRLHTIGIDRAVNAGFLGRLAALGAGRAELVESEDRLDEAMEHIHRRIGAPVVTGLSLTADDVTALEGTRSPQRLPGLYPGVPLVVTGRYSGSTAGTFTVTGTTRDEQAFQATIPLRERAEPAVTKQWARARLRDLEDAFAAGDHTLEQQIVETSLRFGVLCRFTAYVAVDERVVNEGGEVRRVTQPVEMPSGWESTAPPMAAGMILASASSPFPGGPAPAAPGMFPPAPPIPGGPVPSRPRFAPASAKLRASHRQPDAFDDARLAGQPPIVGGPPPSADSPASPAASPPAPTSDASTPAGGSSAPTGSVPASASGPTSPAGGPQSPAGGPPSPAGGVPRSASGLPAGGGRVSPRGFGRSRQPADAGIPLADIRQLATVEAGRLRDAADHPDYERRDLLDDLASRLTVLLTPLSGDDFGPLQALITLLNGNAPLAEKWSTALRVLTEFGAPTSPKRATKPFWKR